MLSSARCIPIVITLLAGTVLVAGCSAVDSGPENAQTPTSAPTAAAPTSAAPTPTASATAATLTTPPTATPFPSSELADRENLWDSLVDKASGEAPTIRLYSTLTAEAPAVLADASSLATGQKQLRIACSTLTGSDLAIVITFDSGDPVQFSAPCGSGLSTATSDGPMFTTDGPYTITATAAEPAAVATGITRL